MTEGIGLGMGFKLDAKSHLDVRKSFKTVEEMKNFPETSIPEGFTTFNEETALEYQFLSTNEVSETLGKWRVKEYGSGGPTSDVQQRCVVPYEDNKAYQANVSLVLKDSLLYLCKVTNQDATWTPAHWELIGNDINELTVDDVKKFLSLTPNQLDTLAKIINNGSIEVSKTWSSSMIYAVIQDTLKEAKQYCITKIAQKLTSSFKKVNNTTEVTDGNYLYLILNPSTSKYDIYALVDSNVELLTSVDVNFDDYYTKTEVDNDFLKKTDATSTYATITTVDGKVDKTNVLTATSITATDDQVYSAKAINTELDDVVKKTDISTVIDGTSTNDTVPTNKAVYDSLLNKVDNTIVLTTADEVNSFDRVYQSFIIEPSVAEAVGLPKAPDSTWFCINLSHFKGFKYPSQIAFEYAGIERIMYRTAHNGVWHNWRKMPTTSVADVPFTKLTLDSSVFTTLNVNNYISYVVYNGMCTITCKGIGLVSAGIYDIASDIPKPVGGYATNILQVKSGAIVPTNPVFLTVDNSTAKLFSESSTGPFWGTVTYPVAE